MATTIGWKSAVWKMEWILGLSLSVKELGGPIRVVGSQDATHRMVGLLKCMSLEGVPRIVNNFVHC